MSRSVLLLLAVTAACGTEGDSVEGPEEWALAEDLVVGRVGDDLELARVLDLIPNPEGGFSVTQWQVGEVQQADQTGSPEAVIGRSGGGPGEFSQPSTMGWLGDTLWVTDRFEIEFFSTGGEHQGQLTFRETLDADLGVSYGPGIPFADGLLVGTPSYTMTQAVSGTLARVPILVTDRNGTIVDSIGHQGLDGRSYEVAFHGGGGIVGRHPLPPTPDYSVSPDGSSVVWVDWSGEQVFKVTKVGAALDTVFVVDFPFEPIEFRAEWVEGFLEEQASPIAEAMGAPLGQVVEDLRAGLGLSGVSPPVRALVVGADGTVWMKRESREQGVATWEVLDEQGGLEARVRMPEDLTVHHAARNLVWGIRPGQFDEPVVYRYIVHRDRGGA